MRIFRHKKASDWVQRPDGKWIKENPDVIDILEALEATRPCLSTEDPAWTPEEHESFVQELKKYPTGTYGLIKRIGTKSTTQVTSYGIKCWESDEYQQIVANRQERRARRPSNRVRKWLRAALKWCGDVFSLRCLRSQSDDKPQVTVYSDDLYSPGIFDTESLRSRPIPTRGAIALSSVDEDDSDMRLAQAADIEWYTSRVSRSAPNIPASEKKTGPWTKEEHERYCDALEMYRYGSWKLIADYVGTRTDRQVMSHAQSIRAKRKRTEKREEQQRMTKNEQRGEPTKLAKTTAGGRVNSLAGITTPTTDTPSQEARHSLELPDETAKGLSSTKASEAFDSPLCSPPPDFLIGSFLSDEDFFELIDPLSPLTGETFTL
ncbi:hypothetical protein DVH05_006886 [Phytophthora capsici]|nr:hypothetical protein DVH05_006886 [Phytophthora capsici]